MKCKYCNAEMEFDSTDGYGVYESHSYVCSCGASVIIYENGADDSWEEGDVSVKKGIDILNEFIADKDKLINFLMNRFCPSVIKLDESNGCNNNCDECWKTALEKEYK